MKAKSTRPPRGASRPRAAPSGKKRDEGEGQLTFELGFHKARADRAEKRAIKEAGEKRALERKLIDAKRRKQVQGKKRKGTRKIPSDKLAEIVARLRSAGTKKRDLSGKVRNALKAIGFDVSQRTAKDSIDELDAAK